MKNWQKHSARRYADLSLQFYRDRQGTPNFLVTSNPKYDGEYFFTGVDAQIFAKRLIECSLVSREELLFLCRFFETVKRRIEEDKK